MRRRIIDNVEIISRGINDLTDDEIRKYIQYVYDNAEYTEYDKLESLKLTLCPDGKIDIDYKFNGQKFERIRRITGYLVGTLDRWNNSKQAEERERVKHDRGVSKMNIETKNFEDFKKELSPCYVDEDGNAVAVIGVEESDIDDDENEIALREFISENGRWIVARISEEGDVEVIAAYKNSDDAEDALHAICKKNNWKLYTENDDENGENLEYSFNW